MAHDPMRTRIYEHPHSIAALNIERRLPTEDIVIFCLISRPENRPLAEMDEKVRQHRETPVEQLRCSLRTETITLSSRLLPHVCDQPSGPRAGLSCKRML